MRIRELTLRNFRGFEDATVDLDRPLTVLFGENGSGKSSVLGAIVAVLSQILWRATREETWGYDLQISDIRHGADALSISASFTNGDASERLDAECHRGHPSPKRRYDGRAGHLQTAAPSLYVFYGAARDVARAVDAFSTSAAGNGAEAPPWTSALNDALGAGEIKFRSFFQWFKAREDIENELKVSTQDLSREDPQLGAVRRAAASMLPGFSGLRIQRDPLHMIIRKADATLEIDQLSDGEKLLLTLGADLARRLAITYPDLPDPLQGEAIVLVDEIELHLHPAWQRRVLASLRSAFPGCQLIVTTHSPQVLSEVPNDAVVLVEDFQFVRPAAPTAGRDSNAILSEAMKTPERPSAQLETIRSIAALIDEGKHAEARARLDSFARQVSELDREVVGLRTMLHFLEDGDEADPQAG